MYVTFHVIMASCINCPSPKVFPVEYELVGKQFRLKFAIFTNLFCFTDNKW